MVNWLSEYVKYKSVTGEELEVQEKFVFPAVRTLDPNHVELYAVDKERKRPNLVATFKGAGKGRSLLFNGHTDVAPMSEEQLKRWRVDPWKATREGELVYGHGVADMKGGIAAMIWAIIHLWISFGVLVGVIVRRVAWLMLLSCFVLRGF